MSSFPKRRREAPRSINTLFENISNASLLKDYIEGPEKVKVISRKNVSLFLFVAYALTSASTTIPVLLTPSIAKDLYKNDLSSQSWFVSCVVIYTVLGTAIGKFVNGPICDVFGARRTSCVYSLLLALNLFLLSIWRKSPYELMLGLGSIEFLMSVQWPCYLNILAHHYNNNDVLYERGIYITSLGSRFGVLCCLLCMSLLLRIINDVNWRIIMRNIGCVSACLGFIVIALCIWDSPNKIHDPASNGMFLVYFIPAFKSVVGSGIFWLVSIAHCGSALIRSSERILGMYFKDTSTSSSLSNEEFSTMGFSLSFGLCFGLAINGNLFTTSFSRSEKTRRKFIVLLYASTVVCCYALAILGIDKVRNFFHNEKFVMTLQILITFCMGASISVQYHTIPAIVATMFENEKGMYASYTDGVACTMTAIIWKIIGNMVQRADSQKSGWAYGWAVIAVLVVISAVVMVEFLDYYFCFGKKSVHPSKLFHTSYHKIPYHEMIFCNSNQPSSLTKALQQPTHPTEQKILQNRLQALLNLPFNQHCNECNMVLPRWVSIHLVNTILLPVTHQSSTFIGCFCCHECAGCHLHLNTAFVVRSVDHDTSWKEWEVQALEYSYDISNQACLVNSIFEKKLKNKKTIINSQSSREQRQHFLQHKYEKQAFVQIQQPTALLDASSVTSSDGQNESSVLLELVSCPSTSPTPHYSHNQSLDIIGERSYEDDPIISPISVTSSNMDLLDDNFTI